jgi:N-acetylmuramoyl-L-alanine amidase
VRIIRAGDGGDDVRDVQQRLLALQASIDTDELDGRFGPSTEIAVRAFQAERRLPVDGLVGPDTWSQLVEAGYELGDRALYLRYPFLRGDDVRALQRRLNALGFDAGREDGILGRETDGAIRDFQRNVGQVADGIVGPDTVAALGRLRPDITATSRAVVREAEELRVPRGTIVGAVIAIDPGHGGADEGVLGPSGTSESRATLAIARALSRRLSEGGAVPLLLREADDDPTPSDRAAAANEAHAAACVSIHVGGEGTEIPGAACTYFGTSTTHSPAGQRLAELIQQRLCDRLGLKDLGTSRLAISILRETKMPAVQVEPSRISIAEEEQRLRDPGFVDGLAEAITDALREFLS